MLRAPVAILLIVSILCSCFSNLIIRAGFELNRKYIAATFCVNTDKPFMNCKGRCFLTKKIKEAEEKQQKEDKERAKPQQTDAVITQASRFVFIPAVVANKHYPVNNADPLSSYTPDIFHPPARLLKTI